MSKNSQVCCDTINEVICSIAHEEAGLSHILNAEGEKIQKALEVANSVEELLEVNCSVRNTISEVTGLEIVLLNKLKSALEAKCEGRDPKPKNGSLSIYIYSCNKMCPLPNIAVEVFDCDGKSVDCGETDKNGVYFLGNLAEGFYKVVVCDIATKETKTCKFSINESQLKVSIKTCFETCNEKFVKIKGYVLDCYDKRLCNARVVAKGKITKEAVTNECGEYEITDLNIEDCFSIFASYNGVSSTTYINSNPIYNCYTYRLKINTSTPDNETKDASYN